VDVLAYARNGLKRPAARAAWAGGVAAISLGGVIAVQGATASAGLTDRMAAQAQMATAERSDALLGEYCASCHSGARKQGGFSIEGLRGADLAAGLNTDSWEKILRKVSLGEMPPHYEDRPSQEVLNQFTAGLATSLDRYAAANPDPGRTVLRRMNRAEYANAVRDLLDYDVDISKDLPVDDTNFGFDNIAEVLTVSPTLMSRYMAVGAKVSRSAVGISSRQPSVFTYTVPKDVSTRNLGKPAYNERASDELPLDSRGGGAFQYYAPYDATYEIRAYLNSNTNTDVEFTRENQVRLRVPLTAGLHTIGMSFPRALAKDETVQKVTNDTYVIIVQVDGVRVKSLIVPSYNMHPQFSQNNFPRDVLQIEVEGPFEVTGVGQTPSRRAVFSCYPKSEAEEAPCARNIIQTLARRAYRRPVTAADVNPLMKVYASVRETKDFDNGVAAAVQAVLVSPQFLFLQESAPQRAQPGSVHRLSDLELASRLSFFLWSSIPDETLLQVAEKGQLSDPTVLKQQVERMLKSRKAEALTKNFGAQWLYLRNLEYQRPDFDLFPNFDARLRSAMQQETEMFFSSIVRQNGSVLDFLDSDYTFLNQRLAEHYGIKGVYGTAFRKVALDKSSNRGGLLGQGSILTVTSYADHTSVVKRGQWILENLLAAAPPPPPPNVPALVQISNGKALSAREQMEMHRADPVCASCHMTMDPLGFSLENYDAVGAWRETDNNMRIDASAALPDGTMINGAAGLQEVLMGRKGQFVGAFSERLLTYALARGLRAQDMPTVRAIAAKAQAEDYRINAIIMGIVTSDPFVMKRTPGT